MEKSASVSREISFKDAIRVVDSKGKLLIPKVIRERAAIPPGSLVRLEPLGEGKVLVLVVDPAPVLRVLNEQVAPALALLKQKK